MPRPPFLANVIAVLFLLGAAAVVALRSSFEFWAPIAATGVAGAVAAEAIGLVLSRGVRAAGR